MSGIFTRSSYDECYFKERNQTNENNFNHLMNMNLYVNNDLNLNKSACPHSIQGALHCATCTVNNNAKLLQTPNHFGKRTEIESSLFGIGRPFALCSTGKFGSCGKFNNMQIEKSNNNQKLYNDPAYHALESRQKPFVSPPRSSRSSRSSTPPKSRLPPVPKHPQTKSVHDSKANKLSKNGHRIVSSPNRTRLSHNEVNYTLPFYLQHANQPSNRNLPFECNNEIALNPWLCERDIVPTNMIF